MVPLNNKADAMSIYSVSSGTTSIRSQDDLPSGTWMFAFSEGPAALDINASLFDTSGANPFFRTVETEGRFGLEAASFVLFADRGGSANPIAITIRIDGASFNAQGFFFGGFGPEDSFSILGGTGAETILGASFIANQISGGGGADYLRGGEFSDVFLYEAAGDAQAGDLETVDGRFGIDMLRIAAAVDLSAGELLSIEKVAFAGNNASLVLASSQFGNGKLEQTLEVAGGEGANTLTIKAAGTFSANALNFTGWSAEDSLILEGGAGSDALTAGKVSTLLQGQGGNDALTGGAADDGLEGGSGDDVLAGGAGADSLAGGEGFDSVSYAADAPVSISLVDQAGNSAQQQVIASQALSVLSSPQEMTVSRLSPPRFQRLMAGRAATF